MYPGACTTIGAHYNAGVCRRQGAYDEELAGVHGGADSDSDDDDDMSSFHGDHDVCDETSDDEPDLRELKSRGLEWDESDLSKYQCKV